MRIYYGSTIAETSSKASAYQISKEMIQNTLLSAGKKSYSSEALFSVEAFTISFSCVSVDFAENFLKVMSLDIPAVIIEDEMYGFSGYYEIISDSISYEVFDYACARIPSFEIRKV